MKTDQLTIGHQGSNGMWCPAVVGRGTLVGYNSKQRYWSVRGEAKSSTQAEYPHLHVQMRSVDTWCAALKNHHLFLCTGMSVSEQIPVSCREWQWLWRATWMHTFPPSCRSGRNGEDCHRLSCLAVQNKSMFKEKLVFHNATDSHQCMSLHAHIITWADSHVVSQVEEIAVAWQLTAAKPATAVWDGVKRFVKCETTRLF